jgi:sterol desaturase/sphingolipid hydroxylase (fatty acid hydroxylase superfamily)
MSATAIEAARLGAKLLLVVAIFVPLERLFALRRQKVLRAGMLTDLAYYVIGGFVPKLLLVIPLSLLAWVIHAALPSPFYAMMGGLPLALRLPVAFVVGEIGYYWAHRAMHAVPFLWRCHAVHHSAEEMDWLVNVRGHPLDIFLGRLGGLLPIYLLGLAQPAAGTADAVPVLVALVGSLWGFFVHANLRFRFGWLEWLVATPAFHHWHHTNDGPEVVDKNFAAMLPVIDRLFGTFHLPRARPARYGIDDALPADLVGQLLHPVWHERRVTPPRDTLAARIQQGGTQA